MGDIALGFLLGITILSLLWLAVRASASSKRDSRSTPTTNPPESFEESLSDARTRLARVEADQADLFASLEKAHTTLKRLTSRAGMQDLRRTRSEPSESAPPIGASKAELLRHYGMAGKVGPEFAQAQLDLERKQRTN